MRTEWTHADGRSLAVVHLSREVRGLCFFETGDEQPALKECRFVSRELVTDPEAILADWNPGVAAIATPLLRALPIGSLRRELMADGTDDESDPEVSWYNTKTRETHTEKFPMHFRRPQNREAAILRARVAVRYEELVREGSPSPTKQIADDFFEGDLAKAKNVVHNARRSGLLSEANPGQVGGVATDMAKQLLAVADVSDTLRDRIFGEDN